MFLRKLDYEKQIQTDNLAQISEGNEYNRTNSELAAQAEAESYLIQRYETREIFADTYDYSNTATYFGKNLVEYTEAAWATLTAYVIGQRIVYLGKIYEALINNVGTIPSTNPLTWSYIVDDKQLFYASLPYPEWNKDTKYQIGTQVWYKDFVYTANLVTTGQIPSDLVGWTSPALYSFTAIKPTDITKWTKGDNRNQLLVLYMVDISLYHLHSRINPRNIPQLRMQRYDDAIKWFTAISSGSLTANLKEKDIYIGNSIRWGSSIKNVNKY